MTDIDILISMRDSTYSSKLIISSLMPVLLCVIFYRTVVYGESSGEKEERGSRIPDIKYLYLLIYVCAVEMAMIGYISTGSIFRVCDSENRISNFLFVYGGQRIVYRMSHYLHDTMEVGTILLVTLVSCKYMMMGSVVVGVGEMKMWVVLVLFNMGKVVGIGYSLSYVFNTKKTILSYFNVVYMMVCILMYAGAVYGYMRDGDEGGVVCVGNRINMFKWSMDMMIIVYSEQYDGVSGGVELVEFMGIMRDGIVRRYGGFGFHLAGLMCHFVVYFCLHVVFDRMRYGVGVDNKRSSREVVDVSSIRSDSEVREETEYVQSCSPQISVYGVDKVYSNGCIADHKVTFGVEKNKILTILGPNGAGKSSLLDIMCGISNRSRGDVSYKGESIDKHNMRLVSFCLQTNYLWEYLTFEEHVRTIGQWRGLSDEVIGGLLKDIEKGLDIGKNMRIKAIHLSGGNKRKLNTVLSLLSSPEILILDEPTAGMDPTSRRYG